MFYAFPDLFDPRFGVLALGCGVGKEGVDGVFWEDGAESVVHLDMVSEAVIGFEGLVGVGFVEVDVVEGFTVVGEYVR